jgi:hypothetical protein
MKVRREEATSTPCPTNPTMNDEKNARKTLSAQVPHQLQPHTFQPGNPGGPGRPKGSIGIKRLMRETLWKDGGAAVQKIVDLVISKSGYDLAYTRFLLSTLDEVAEHDPNP